MRRETLPISAIPAWCKLNNISLLDVSVRDLGSQGHGIVTERRLESTEETFDLPVLLIVPNELILCREMIDEHAKVDHHFRELLEVAGGKSFRMDAMLFLLMQATMSSTEHTQVVGVSNPWTEYVKMLPDFIPLPTLWTEEEIVMLQGTSLESAVNAKSASLLQEYEAIRDSTSSITWCQKYWWEDDIFQLMDWKLIDAWFRSRSLEYPVMGEVMIPSLDMVNHSIKPNAYYEPGTTGNIHLLMRPSLKLESGTEVTISYGELKSAAEMLFSYGFIDEEIITKSLSISLEPDPQDPFGRAKAVAFSGPKTVQLSTEGNETRWESHYLYLLCVNEEDGLDFKVLQETDGTTSSLRTFWQGQDVTDSTNNFESLVESCENLREVFKLRAVVLLEEHIQSQLSRLYESDEELEALAEAVDLAIERQEVAIRLREYERDILLAALKATSAEKEALLHHENVIRYLGFSTGNLKDESENQEAASNDDDFS